MRSGTALALKVQEISLCALAYFGCMSVIVTRKRTLPLTLRPIKIRLKQHSIN